VLLDILSSNFTVNIAYETEIYWVSKTWGMLPSVESISLSMTNVFVVLNRERRRFFVKPKIEIL
jgi:hypothetical protein